MIKSSHFVIYINESIILNDALDIKYELIHPEMNTVTMNWEKKIDRQTLWKLSNQLKMIGVTMKSGNKKSKMKLTKK